MRKIDTLTKVIVRALVRWSWLLVICILVGYFGGKAVSTALPPTFAATAIVQLNAQTRATQVIQPVAAYATLVTSDSVLNPVLQKYPQLDRQTFISRDLVVTSVVAAQTISIQVTLPQAKVAADAANMLAQLLVDQQNAYIKAQYNTELQAAQAHIDSDRKTLDDLNQQYVKESQANPPNTALLQQLSNQITQQQTLLNQDTTDQRTLTTEQALYNAPLSVVQSATVPTKPSSLLGSIPLAPLVLALTLIVGLVIISFLEQSAGRINGTYALQQKAAIPILGTLRWTNPAPPSLPLRAIAESKTPYTEDCRVMMADVLFHAEEAQSHILAFTAMKERAGSSSVAAQLAALLAQSRRTVLLIDANLHMPSLYDRLGIPNEAGLARMLEEARKVKTGNTLPGQTVEIADRLPVDSYILPTSIPNLFLLPAGKPAMNPTSLLSMAEMGQFLRWAAKPVDFIIVDCPALAHAEAHVLGSISDQTFLVVDATRDRIRQVVNAREDLAGAGVKVSGLIVNKMGRWI